MKNKDSYVSQFRRSPLDVPSGQDFSVALFQPGDELGIARLYHAVYGEEYPVEDYYIPERILELNQNKGLCSAVCRSSDGNIIGHGALYRSSPPYPRLYEVGQYLVLDNYRKSGVASKINECVHFSISTQIPADGIFGEAVTNHTITQYFDIQVNMTDYALELSLLSPGSGREGASGRVSCVLQFKTISDREHTVFIPAIYKTEIDFLLKDSDFVRMIQISEAPLPQNHRTNCQVRNFTGAGTSRMTFHQLGSDFAAVAGELEISAIRNGCVTLQAFLNLSDPAVGAAVDLLMSRGWFMGGYLPRWFDTDGFLMQKILETPDFDSIRLLSPKARDFLEIVKGEYEAVKLFKK